MSQEERIDEAALRASLRNVHQVSERDRAIAATRDTQIGWLDAGERELWAHAISREDAWLLCGPDAASLRVGIRLGFRERLTALEALCTEADPICSDHDPAAASDDRALHGAACHGCLLVAETSCEARNLFLDRALLVDTVGTRGCGFFQ